MPISDTTDPVIADADQRVERAKASLRSRIHLLERKLGDVRDRLDVPEKISRHPWPAVGVAFALGALAGWRASPTLPRVSTERSLAALAASALGALGVQIVRELVVAQLGRSAKRWWSEHGGRFPDELGPTEAGDVYFEQ